MTMIDETHRRYRFCPTVLVQTDLVPAVLLDLANGHYFEANDSAHELVVAMQRTATLSELTERLQQAFGIGAETALQDARLVLEDWQRRGWVERAP